MANKVRVIRGAELGTRKMRANIAIALKLTGIRVVKPLKLLEIVLPYGRTQ